MGMVENGRSQARRKEQVRNHSHHRPLGSKEQVSQMDAKMLELGKQQTGFGATGYSFHLYIG